MNFISQSTGYWLLLCFGIAMFLITFFFARWERWHTKDGFLVASRNVGWLLGGFSIAASWIWAPALFVSVQMAYQKGLAGIFWFTLPNILSLTIFALLAPRIRRRLPEGYTLPEYVKFKFRTRRVHTIYLFPFLFYQLMAVVVQLYAGSGLVSLLTGISQPLVMVILAVIVLAYTLISGLEASIVTDFVQLSMIFVVGLIIIPKAWAAGGGYASVASGLSGISGTRNVLDPSVAFSFGIVTSIGLIAGSISDQSNWQRAFAVRQKELVKAFVFGSLLFGVVPIVLSVLGFLAANPALRITLPVGTDVSMIGVQTIAHLLPSWAVLLFTIMLLAALSSALDAGLVALSSLWVADISKPTTDEGAVRSARSSMAVMTVLGLLVALGVLYIPGFGLQQLWWVFNTIAACVMVPTVLSLYWDGLSETGVFWGILVAFVIGVPLFIYGNIIDKPVWIVGASVFIVVVSTLFCVLTGKRGPGIGGPTPAAEKVK
jgi:Na+/proline symporter